MLIMKKYLLGSILLIIALTSKAQYTTTNIVSGLDYPVCLTIANDGRYFVSLKGGTGQFATQNAQVDVYLSNGTFQATLWDFTDSTENYFERGVLGVALDPDFNTNHYVYVFYNHNLGSDKIRVFRFTETNGVGSNPVVIFDLDDPHSAGNHTGGNIHFGPDGKLYISIGDRAVQANSQDTTDNPFGKFIRLNADGTIPTDNPFYDDGNPATGNDDRIWSYGHRNQFDFTFSTVNDSLYSSENGLNTWDEVNMIHKGGNYGWPTCEGFFNQGSTSTPCSLAGSVLPLDDWNAPLPAVTGIMIYDHTLMPEFTNHMLVCDYDGGDITDFTLDNSPAYDNVASRAIVPVTLSGLTDMVQGNEGCIYVIQGGYTSNGKITRICPVGLSVDEETAASFSVFPNPATNNISLGVSEALVNGDITIKNLIGQTVYASVVNTTNLSIDITSFEKGVYFVIMENNGKVLSQKLIIE